MRKIGIITIISLITSACVPADGSVGTVSRQSATLDTAFDVGSLPVPGKWSDEDIWFYFNTTNRLRVDPDNHTPHQLTNRVASKCGSHYQVPPRNSSHTASIQFYKRALQELPKLTQCWVETGPALVERRIAELEYLHALLPYAEQVPPPHGRKVSDPGLKHWRTRNTIEKEIQLYEANLRSLLKSEQRYQNAISRNRTYQKRSRESWGRAFESAVHSLANDNPLTRPSPGTNALYSDTIGNVSPGARLALTRLDQTLLGDDAYYREINRRAASMGAAQIAAAQRAASTNASGAALTLTSHCSIGRKPDGKCMSWEEQQAATQAQIAAAQNQREIESSAIAARVAARNSSARKAANDRIEQAARECARAHGFEYVPGQGSPCR